MVFSNDEEVEIAYNNKVVRLHAKIKVRIDGKMIETTVGRVIFNKIVPKEMGLYQSVAREKIFSVQFSQDVHETW
ncbi:hypothetical protein MASR1M107_25640 [Ignavibacteriales bacterium]